MKGQKIDIKRNHVLKMMQNKYTFIQSFCLLFLLVFSFIQPVNAADWLYTMRPGDTLWTLCKEYTKEPNCWQKLGPLNKIARDRAIPPGTRIRIPANWLKVPAASASIAFVQGDVSYQLLGDKELAAAEGVELTIGSKLVTGNGTVSLVFADGSSMVLEPNSQLELDTLSNFDLNGMVDSTVRLNQGTVKTRVIKREPRSHFKTITPSAVAAVRGTEYRVNVVSENQENTITQTTFVEVYQGLVDVGSENITFPVPASFGIISKQGKTLQEPVKLLDKPEFAPFPEQQTLFVDDNGKPNMPILITWNSIELAAEFQLNILFDPSNDTKTEKLLKSYRTESNSVNLNDLALGCYQLSLRAIDQLGLHGLAAVKRLCLNQQITTPLIKSIQLSSDSDVQQVQLEWDQVDNAQTYRIDVSDTPEFSTLISSFETSELSYIVDQQTSELFVRVQALSQTGELSNYSQNIHVQAKALVEENDTWKILIPIGLFLLAFL